MTAQGRRFLVAAGDRALRIDPVGRAAARFAARRDHRLALVFHRVVSGEATPGGVVTQVSAATFRAQLEVLLDLGEIVPLTSLLDPASGRRPRFAITFDDDWTTHRDVVLPILDELGLTATFFLCGRSLHGLGPLWFEVLDALLLDHGPGHAARVLGVPVDTPGALGVRCQRDRAMQRRLVEEGADVGSALDRTAIGELARAGMTIGFHTLRHELMTELPSEGIAEALDEGRSELEAVVGGRLTLFAFPHGAADPRVAARVRETGYRAAWTGRQRPTVPGADPFLLGRWEPGPLGSEGFRARVAANLNGWAGS
jgi:peptidoglycan/xylan/chitin deacetylase (PgdA/CDA1 family)